MSVNKEFQDAIKAGKLKEALLIAFSNNLKFQTNTSIICAENNQPYSWRSKISLLEGLETQISPQLLNGKYKEINQFHQQQVNQADETWQKNRETLIKVFQLLVGIATKQEIAQENQEETFDLDLENIPVETKGDIETPSQELNMDDLSLDNQKNKKEGEDLELEKNPPEAGAETEMPLEELNMDDFSLDNDIQNEQETFKQKSENVESHNPMEEGWGDFLDDLNQNEPDNLTQNPSSSSSNSERENNEDWGEWLDQGDLSAKSSPTKMEEIDWEDEENWEDLNSNNPVENVSQEK